MNDGETRDVMDMCKFLSRRAGRFRSLLVLHSDNDLLRPNPNKLVISNHLHVSINAMRL
jgi:hypothetical protein